jgi:signal transduction histidine kinase
MDGNDTMFAPAERADTESVLRDAETLQRAVFAENVVRMMPSLFMVLNRERQVVYKSQRLMDLLGVSSDQEILGKRPGELLNCIHAYERATGCGTTEFCRECGAVRAILESQQDKVGVEKECRVTSTAGDAHEFRVWASPFTSEGVDYTLFFLADIRDEKRRHALEKTFFHDVNNILTVILGCCSLLGNKKDVETISEHINTIQMAGIKLVEEIASHRRLLQAENGELAVTISNIESLSLLGEVMKLFSADKKWTDRNIVMDENSDGVEIATDRVLLRRVLENMVKNALEATSDGEEVCLACARSQSSIVFSVHNPGYMPRSVQLQMFQRSFSTKGKGRGIGTYSMKLFGEQYLKGNVWFFTSEDKGTTFFISVPLSYEDV